MSCIQRNALKITLQWQTKITGRRWKRKKPDFPRSVCYDLQKRCPVLLWGKKRFFKVKPCPRNNFKMWLKSILAINIKIKQ